MRPELIEAFEYLEEMLDEQYDYFDPGYEDEPTLQEFYDQVEVIVLHGAPHLPFQHIQRPFAGLPLTYESYMRKIKEFLDKNPKEIVIVLLEDYVNSKALYDHIYEKVGLTNYIFNKETSPVKPTLKWLIDNNKRLLIGFSGILSSVASGMRGFYHTPTPSIGNYQIRNGIDLWKRIQPLPEYPNGIILDYADIGDGLGFVNAINILNKAKYLK